MTLGKKVTAASFLKNMGAEDQDAPEADAVVVSPRAGATTRKGGTPSKTNQTLKHFGGYLEPEVFEKIALLRARLKLDNSELMTKAIEELFSRQAAARKFGDH